MVWLRWIAVLPGAIVAALLAMFPWHWVVLFYASFAGKTGYGGEETFGLGTLLRIIGPESVERAGYGFLTPFVMITIAARIAPRFKVPTAVIMSILWVSYIGWFWLVGLEGRSIDILPTLIANILSAIGILVAWKYARPWWEESD